MVVHSSWENIIQLFWPVNWQHLGPIKNWMDGYTQEAMVNGFIFKCKPVMLFRSWHWDWWCLISFLGCGQWNWVHSSKSGPWDQLSLLEHEANTKVTGLIPVWTIHLRFELSDPWWVPSNLEYFMKSVKLVADTKHTGCGAIDTWGGRNVIQRLDRWAYVNLIKMQGPAAGSGQSQAEMQVG